MSTEELSKRQRDPQPSGVESTSEDPILERRATIRARANAAQRIGYAAFGLAMVGFFLGLFTRFSSGLVTFVIAMLIGGSIILAVAIQVGYAIRGAERHEEDSLAMRRGRGVTRE